MLAISLQNSTLNGNVSSFCLTERVSVHNIFKMVDERAMS